MDDQEMPTVILKSFKDMDRFLGLKDSLSNTSKSPCQKLEFEDSTSDAFSDSLNVTEYSGKGGEFVRKHQQNVAGLDIAKKIREKDKELLDAKTEILLLEGKLKRYQSLVMETREDFDGQIEELRKRHSQDKEKVEDLSQKLRQAEIAKKRAEEDLSLYMQESKLKMHQFEKKLHSRHNPSEKMDQLQEESSNLRQKVTSLEKDLEIRSKDLELQEKKNQGMESLMETLRSKVSDSHKVAYKNEDLQLQLSQSVFRNTELQMRLDSIKSKEDQLASYEKAIKELPMVRKELTKVRDEVHTLRLTRVNSELLEEKLSSSENQRQMAETRSKELLAENATLVTLRELMEKYEEALKSEFQLEYLPPVQEFVSLLRSLKQKDDGVSESISELKANLESHQSTHESQNLELEKLKSNLKENSEELEKSSTIIKRLQRKIFLLSKERDSLQYILTSYESESTLNPSAIEQEKVSRLEGILQEYKSEVAKLETELNRFQKIGGREGTTNVESSTEVDRDLRNEVDELKKEVLTLKEDKMVLMDQMDQLGAQGGFDPRQTKVLHLSDNPLEKAHRERKMKLETLTMENETLKKRVKLLEEGENEDLTVKVGAKVDHSAASMKKLKELEDQLKTSETRNERIIESFKRKSQEMREVVYRLTGYRVDLREDNHYRLSNIYSESSNDFFLFEQTSEGDLQLLETDFSSTLEDLIETYLHQDNSYPAFLSALTLQLFKKQDIEDSSEEEEIAQAQMEEDEDFDYQDDGEGEYEVQEEDGDMEREHSDSNDTIDEEPSEDESDWEEEDNDQHPTKRQKTESDSEADLDQGRTYDDDDDDELICLD